MLRRWLQELHDVIFDRAAFDKRRHDDWFGDVHVVDDELERRRRGVVYWRIQREDVARLELYKIDLITTDDICCDIIFADGNRFTIDEELAGWHDALAWFESFPGFRNSWWQDVVKPPMAECRQVVFERKA